MMAKNEEGRGLVMEALNKMTVGAGTTTEKGVSHMSTCCKLKCKVCESHFCCTFHEERQGSTEYF